MDKKLLYIPPKAESLEIKTGGIVLTSTLQAVTGFYNPDAAYVDITWTD